MYIDKPGWYRTQSGKPVVIQEWDSRPPRIPHSMKAFWRGMVILEVENRTITRWKCIWFTVSGVGYSPDFERVVG